MNDLLYIVAGLSLPLFPLSMVFNALFAQVRQPALRSILLLIWPQLGLLLLSLMDASQLSPWIVPLAISTSALYAFRAIAARELGQWSGYLATSLWALLWLFVAMDGQSVVSIHWHALGFSLPLALLIGLGSHIEQRFGAAYTGLYGGLAQSMPRLSSILVLIVLAVIATPLFPSFFTMTQLIFHEVQASLWVPLSISLIWLFWSWSGLRLLQGLIVGPADRELYAQEISDISIASAWGYVFLIIALTAGSLLILRMI